METLRRSFNVHVGYSDHTAGITIPIAAVALGASIIEKHFTLDKTFNGPDHQASIEPHELKEMIKSIREVEEAKGSSIKAVAASEIKNIPIARKSLVAKVDILKGDLFTLENLDCKRPGKGISPMMIDYVIGRVAPRSFKKDEIIEA